MKIPTSFALLFAAFVTSETITFAANIRSPLDYPRVKLLFENLAQRGDARSFGATGGTLTLTGSSAISFNGSLLTSAVRVTGAGATLRLEPVLIEISGQSTVQPLGAAANLIKTGAGTVQLNGNNIYTGTTIDTGGLVDGRLGGIGTIGGSLTVGSTLNPGNSIGTLTSNGGGLQLGSNLVVGNINTAATINTGLSSVTVPLTLGNSGSVFPLASGGTLNSNMGTFVIGPNGSTILVPEPGSVALLLCGAGAFVFRRRRGR